MSEVDPDDETVGRWLVIAHRYDDETRHFRYLPIAAYTTEKEFKRRFNLEAEKLDKRRSQGEAHYKESISGRWEGINPPPVAFWIRSIRLILRKLSGKEYIHLSKSSYAEYKTFLHGEEREDGSERN